MYPGLKWLAIAAICAVPAAAHAQSAEAIQKYLTAHARGCTLYGYREYYRGKIPGIDQTVAIAAYTLESCGGGNNYARTVDVFYGTDAAVRQMRQPMQGVPGPDADDPNGVTLVGDTMTVRYSDYAEADPRCCPSLKRSARFRITNAGVIPAH
jgi:LppP/LprE lipoprotein